MTTQTRKDEIKTIHIKYKDFYRIGGGLTIIIILIIIGSWVFGENQLGFAETMLGYITNVATEGLSVIATIIVVDQLNRRRSREERKLALFRQAKSRSNDMAIEALDQIQHEGWWDDLLEHYTDDDEPSRIDLSQVQWAGGVQLRGVNLEGAKLWKANLKGADLYKANLEGANLEEVNVQESYLERVNLKGADLEEVHLEKSFLELINLEGAKLWSAHLEGAILSEANLTRATLFGANLKGADLYKANLEEANLRGANLTGVNLERANLIRVTLFGTNLTGANLLVAELEGADWEGKDAFGEYAVATLPDGTTWTSETEMERFTNPDHSEYQATLKKINVIRREKGLDLFW